MATILKDAEHFDFVSLQGERLDLFGAALSWSDTVKTGVVEKLVVQRAGSIYQRVGAPGRKFEFRCLFQGAGARAAYNRVVDVVLEQPEGQITHPRFGHMPAVIEEVSGSETPGDATDTIEFTLKIGESGLHDAPKPAASALGQAASTMAATVQTESASIPSIAAAGALVSARAAGLLIAMQAAETGTGSLLDVDASLAALNASVIALDALPDTTQQVRRDAYVALAYGLQARNAFIAGSPALVNYPVDTPTSLSALMQRLYGSRAATEILLAQRLNRIRQPHSIPAGTTLLLTDPAAKVITS